jgi:hypothetical protein
VLPRCGQEYVRRLSAGRSLLSSQPLRVRLAAARWLGVIGSGLLFPVRAISSVTSGVDNETYWAAAAEGAGKEAAGGRAGLRVGGHMGGNLPLKTRRAAL